MIQFTVPGKPVAWQRAGINAAKTGRAIIYTKSESRSYQAVVRDCARAHVEVPTEDAFSLHLQIKCKRPKSHLRTNGELKPSAPTHCCRKPDVDNIAKQIGDALNGLVWHDDSQIVEGMQRREWGERDEVLVRIQELTS